MYPTASAPQYAFGPGLAPVPMPGMAQGGLAALANRYRKGGGIRYFEDGGDASDGGDSPSGSDSPSDDNSGGGGGSDSPAADPGAAAQAAAQGVDNAVDAMADMQAAAEATLGAQVAAEADEAEATQAAENMANLQAQADAVAAEIAAQQEEDAKAATMAAVMKGEVPGFPGPQAQAARGFGITAQNPLSLNKPFFGITDPFVSIDVPFMNQPIEMTPFGVAAPALGKGAQAVSAGIAAGKALGFAEGGITSLANQVQSQGRGQDKMLVHMTPREVQGLQYLAMRHGGSLSINPRTGLVEAGFLSSILPMVAGAALTIGSGGVINPYMSAAIVGGVSGLASGSLSKGLMAGLGAFGGAGLGAGLAGAGTATAPLVTGTEAGLSSAADMAASNLSPEALNAATTTTEGIAQSGINSPYFKMAQSNIDPGLLEGMGGTPGMTAQQVATAPVINPTPAIAPSPTVGFERAGEGLKNVAGFGTPEQVDIARSRFMTDVGGITGLASKAGAAAAPILADRFGDDDGLKKPEQFIRPFRYETGRQNVPYRTGERGESTAEQAYFDSRLTPVGVYKAGTEPAYGTYAMGGSIEEGVKNGDIRAFDDEYGQDEYYGGGLTALAAGGNPTKPRFLMGKGDGMSDSIPATINNTQPARLADGEFVIPADVVSHLGNGSSKAGAAKLHSMMNRIRKARTGKKRQAPEVRAERYMPA